MSWRVNGSADSLEIDLGSTALKEAKKQSLTAQLMRSLKIMVLCEDGGTSHSSTFSWYIASIKYHISIFPLHKGSAPVSKQVLKM